MSRYTLSIKHCSVLFSTAHIHLLFAYPIITMAIFNLLVRSSFNRFTLVSQYNIPFIHNTVQYKLASSSSSSIKDTVEKNTVQTNDSEYGLADPQTVPAIDRGIKSDTNTEQTQYSNVDQTSKANKSASSGGSSDSEFESSQKEAAHKNVRSKQPHPILSRRPPSGSVDYSY